MCVLQGRWERTVKEQTTQLKELPLASLVAAAFTTYLPSFSEDTRASIMKVRVCLRRGDE